MVFSLFLIILVLFGVAMYGILHYLPHDYTRFASLNIDNKSNEKEYILLEYKKDENSKTVDLPEPEVVELSIQEINDGEIEMEFTFANKRAMRMRFSYIKEVFYGEIVGVCRLHIVVF